MTMNSNTINHRAIFQRQLETKLFHLSPQSLFEKYLSNSFFFFTPGRKEEPMGFKPVGFNFFGES